MDFRRISRGFQKDPGAGRPAGPSSRPQGLTAFKAQAFKALRPQGHKALSLGSSYNIDHKINTKSGKELSENLGLNSGLKALKGLRP